jgi:phage-related holin
VISFSLDSIIRKVAIKFFVDVFRTTVGRPFRDGILMAMVRFFDSVIHHETLKVLLNGKMWKVAIKKINFLDGIIRKIAIEFFVDIFRRMMGRSLWDWSSLMIRFFFDGIVREETFKVLLNGKMRKVTIKCIWNCIGIFEGLHSMIAVSVSKFIDWIMTEYILINRCDSIFWASTEAVALVEELGCVGGISTSTTSESSFTSVRWMQFLDCILEFVRTPDNVVPEGS